MPKSESLGLRTLEDISSLILHSHDLRETLDNIVALVSKRMQSDVCSIYLLDDDGETLRLHSTKGLSRASVGKITMNVSEGLTGLVIEQRGVISLENAQEHARYKYFPESGEERYHSFLGIPMFERKSPVGVIVVQHREPRSYTKSEISTLSTIAYQISSIILNAKLLDSIREKDDERALLERELRNIQGSTVGTEGANILSGKKTRNSSNLVGIGGAPGFATGNVYILSRRSQLLASIMETALSPEEEHKKLRLALEKARIQTLYMEKRIADRLSEEDAAIFHAHLLILEDRGFIGKIQELIDQEFGAARAVHEVVNHYREAFARMNDPYLSSRSADMEDIGRRIIDSMDGHTEEQVHFEEKRILVASEILPSDLATMDGVENILGIITEKGDVNSHAAIIARSMGIPAVVAVDGLLRQLSLKDEIILDGNSGHIFINPEPHVRSEYRRLTSDYSLKRRELDGLKDLPAVTRDGLRISLKANIGMISDLKIASLNGAEGVGLYRTEFPFMARRRFPDRNEQTLIYSRILKGFEGQQVTIRTLDIGGDKGLPYFDHPEEENPFMGWRAIRIFLERVDLFRDQLAAIMIAAAGHDARIMFPMISGVEEIGRIREIVAEVKDELRRSGAKFNENIPLGIMIEIPSAVQIADVLAKKADFFSIGTNDLIQYTLAADRNNPKVKPYYSPYHPAILHSIKRVADAGKKAGIPVSICGEMASDPLCSLLLAGLGISDLSMSSPSIPIVKQAVRGATFESVSKIAARVLQLESNEEIKSALKESSIELGIVS
jgi:phosphotransferase system enzyme I (PtsP)